MYMARRVIKAIFPVAGLGTRFLPATKSIPKEIMTLVDKPLIQYAIDEARAAGIKEFIFVTSRGKGALEDYFDSAPVIEASLRKHNKTDLLKILKDSTMDSGEIAYVRQREALEREIQDAVVTLTAPSALMSDVALRVDRAGPWRFGLPTTSL